MTRYADALWQTHPAPENVHGSPCILYRNVDIDWQFAVTSTLTTFSNRLAAALRNKYHAMHSRHIRFLKGKQPQSVLPRHVLTSFKASFRVARLTSQDLQTPCSFEVAAANWQAQENFSNHICLCQHREMPCSDRMACANTRHRHSRFHDLRAARYLGTSLRAEGSGSKLPWEVERR